LRVFAWAAGLLVLSSLPAIAQYVDSSQKLTLARQVVSELMSDDRIDQISDSFLPAIISQLQGQRGRNISQTAAIGIRQVVHDEVHGVIEGALGDLASTYANAFSADELTAIAAFYGSDAGKKLLVQEQTLMSGFMPKIVNRVVADMPSLQTKIQAVFASLPPGDK
jgi:hypothetical protein